MSTLAWKKRKHDITDSLKCGVGLYPIQSGILLHSAITLPKLMRPHNFWLLAERLIANERNPEGFRSAISRAYYAAFLTAVDFLAAMNIYLLGGSGVHTELLNILGNTGDAALLVTRDSLDTLRNQRNKADYDLTDATVETEANAVIRLKGAFNVIAELNRCRLDAPRFAAVSAATRIWVKKLRGIP
jgi:uncharacterized protein (UPF0332 family)